MQIKGEHNEQPRKLWDMEDTAKKEKKRRLDGERK